MENQRRTKSGLSNIIKNIIIPGRLSKEVLEYERNHPGIERLNPREEILLHSSSYIIPTTIWGYVIYKIYDLVNYNFLIEV